MSDPADKLWLLFQAMAKNLNLKIVVEPDGRMKLSHLFREGDERRPPQVEVETFKAYLAKPERKAAILAANGVEPAPPPAPEPKPEETITFGPMPPAAEAAAGYRENPMGPLPELWGMDMGLSGETRPPLEPCPPVGLPALAPKREKKADDGLFAGEDQ